MKSLRVFLISMILLGAYQISMGCAPIAVERWYMFKLCNDVFAQQFERDNDAFWHNYCQKNANEWVSDNDRLEAAQRRGDSDMQTYLEYLGMYENIVSSMQSAWDYPTAAELVQRQSTLGKIADYSVSKCKYGKGQSAQRWCLLYMRANMLLKRYDANIKAWNDIASHYSAGHLKELMRNIYANALLNTGHKREAWNIYAEQNDQQSLLWSVRKYTNLAGIKQIYAEDPNAPVLTYLLQYYVNQLQDVCDAYADNKEYDPEWYGRGEAYAPLPKDVKKEMAQFVSFAAQVARGGKVNDPAMWMSAAALVNYFTGHYDTAYSEIQQAMKMKGTTASKNMARRINMLIYPEVADIQSPAFKQFIADELRWLDKDINATENIDAIHARDRIINLGLAKAFEKLYDMNTAIALLYLNDYNNLKYQRGLYGDSEDAESQRFYDINHNHSDSGYELLNSLSPDEVAAYFSFAAQPTDALSKYIFSQFKHSADYSNDITGTKYLAAGEYEKGLSYLDKVSMPYLNSQAIAPYAAYRDYKKPAWNGFIEVPYNANLSLSRNIKVDFCRDMIALNNDYATASAERKHEIEYLMAVYLYQASSSGQCWFLTDYAWSSWNGGEFIDDEWVEKPKNDKMSEQAAILLNMAAGTNDKNLKAKVLFGLAGIAPDELFKDHYNLYSGKWEYTLLPQSQSYKAYTNLDRYLRSNSVSMPEISRCDVLKQFRKYNKN